MKQVSLDELVAALEVSLDERVAALERLQVEAASRFQASQRLKAIDALLFFIPDFSESDLQRILRKSKYPRPIARSTKLYVMMARLTQICEPKGPAIGPSCAVSLIDFEHLTRDSILDVKGTAGFGLFFSLQYEYGSKFNALDLLSPEQKDLYYRARLFFIGKKKKPTLKSLAANILKEEGDEGYSERSLSRYIQAFRDFKFADQDIRRTMLIQTVESFGQENNWSMRQMHAESYPALVTAVQRAVTSAVIPFITQIQLLFTSIADRLLITPPSKGSQN